MLRYKVIEHGFHDYSVVDTSHEMYCVGVARIGVSWIAYRVCCMLNMGLLKPEPEEIIGFIYGTRNRIEKEAYSDAEKNI